MSDINCCAVESNVSEKTFVKRAPCGCIAQDFKLDYDIDKEIGRGRFAKVCKVRHKKTKSCFAAKIIRRRRNGLDTIEAIHREIEILRLHKSVSSFVSLVDVYETRQEVTLLLEYFCGGDLFHLVLQEDENLPEPFVIVVMKQLVDSVAFLHSKAIVHLDIKPENVLLRRSYPSPEIALCDFGLAKHLDMATKVRDLVGTPDYVAPEILDYEPIVLASDLWSIGVLAYYLLTSISPFNAETKEATYFNVAHVKINYAQDLFEGVSVAAVDFMQKLIRKNPSERLSAVQSLEHDWLINVETTSSNNHLVPQPTLPTEDENKGLLSVTDDMIQLNLIDADPSTTHCDTTTHSYPLAQQQQRDQSSINRIPSSCYVPSVLPVASASVILSCEMKNVLHDTTNGHSAACVLDQSV